MGPPSSHKVTRVSWYLSSCHRNGSSSTGLLPPLVRLPMRFDWSIKDDACTGSSPFARRYSENRCFFLFLRVLRWFSSPRSPEQPIYSAVRDGTSAAGLPHSDIRGSMLICSSPRLIAACHVLLRLLMPRHPLYALFSFFLRFYLRLNYS